MKNSLDPAQMRNCMKNMGLLDTFILSSIQSENFQIEKIPGKFSCKSQSIRTQLDDLSRPFEIYEGGDAPFPPPPVDND